MNFAHKRIGRQKPPWVKIAMAAAVLAVVFVGGQEVYYQLKLKRLPQSTTQVFPFKISEGETAETIARRLEQEGFIDSEWTFYRYAKRSGDARNFQAGKFYLAKNSFIPDLSEKLTHAAIDEVSVTIPEGYTNADIDARLAELDLIQPGEFLECLRSCDFSEFPFLPADPLLREGFFFPDTYFAIPGRFDVEQFAHKLLKTFDDKTKSILANDERNGWDLLKMASIVEKEAWSDEERPIIAGILWKRLDNDWALGADATTRYATGKKTDPLTVTDLRDQNPWNTRAVKGLPPGAICNPGLSAIWAAANPEETEYWYYLHGRDGQVHYAVTASQHEQNKADYL